MQYEGYGKAMYDSIVEQTTFVTGQYTDNKDFVRGSMNEIKDYADFWYDELIDEENCGFDSPTFSCLGSMVERGGAYVLTVGDWVKNLFDGYEEENATENVLDMSFYEQVFTVNGLGVLTVKKGWVVLLVAPEKQQMILEGKTIQVSFDGYWNEYTIYIPDSDPVIKSPELPDDIRTMSGALSAMSKLGITLSFYKDDVEVTPVNDNGSNISVIRDYVNNNPVDVVLPELKPRLVCPDGTQIAMSVTGTTFLSEQGKLMHVEKDGTATVNSVQCNLEWDKPEVGYVDDKASITDSTGNWLDIATGDVAACIDDSCKPKPLDNSLLDYVKNAYDYATGVLKSGTDGLKSLATGAKDLTSLFGTFFSWLPNEMVVLMASGLGITVGLRLFRK